MTDLVVTVPKQLWLGWVAEGDVPGSPVTGEEWAYWLGGKPPSDADAFVGGRLYVVSWGRLRGYAPITRIARPPGGGWGICRRGGAVVCTVAEPIPGFRGYRRRWWERETERPFPHWITEGVDRGRGQWRQVWDGFRRFEDMRIAEFLKAGGDIQ